MDQARTKGLIAGFQSIRKRSEEVLNEINIISGALVENASRGSFHERQTKEELTLISSTKENQARLIVEEFNKFALILSTTIETKLDESFLTIPFKLGEAPLSTVIIKCSFAIGLLEDSISPITTEQKNKVRDLRDLLEKLSPEINDPILEGNISAAMDEYEAGHSLASWLISGRVVNYLIEQIPTEDKNNKDRTAERIKYLKKAGIIEDNDRDTKELLIKAARESRQVGSHEISISPSLVADAQSLLSDSIRILEGVSIKLKNYENKQG
jgi:hypothetical protein